jgi:hypothetical protein
LKANFCTNEHVAHGSPWTAPLWNERQNFVAVGSLNIMDVYAQRLAKLQPKNKGGRNSIAIDFDYPQNEPYTG